MCRPVVAACVLAASAAFPSCAMQPTPQSQPPVPAKVSDVRVPEWAKGAVWYQVFPERFRNGNRANDPHGAGVFLAPWSSDWYRVQPGELDAMLARRGMDKATYKPHRAGPLFDAIFDRRYGGDLQGLTQKLGDLADLGITAIYLNPIFQARSLHKYDATDYRHIDEALAASGPSQAIDSGYYRPPTGADGQPETDDPATWVWTEADEYFVKVFLPACKARGIRVVIDGCFNHTGLEFWAFQHIKRNGKKSPYASWYQCEFDNAGNLVSWTGWPGNTNGYLPEFRQVKGVKGGRDWDATVEKGDLNAGVKKHIFDITRRWMDPNNDGDPSDGIDGWRLDVAGEIGPEFWNDWRALVKGLNPDALIIAEVWSKVQGLGTESGFDTQMNYPFAYPVLDWLRDMDERGGPVPASQLRTRLDAAFAGDAHSTQLIHQNLFASHDTDRYVNMLWNPGRGYDKDCAEQNLDDSPRTKKQANAEDTESAEGKKKHSEPEREYVPYKPGKPPEDVYRLSILGVAIQATYVGSPMIYYGDEWGMWGSDDPTCRKPLQWADQYSDLGAPERADHSPVAWVREEYRKWLTLRRDAEIGPALRLGSVKHIDAGRDGVFAFEREHQGVRVVVVVNRGRDTFDASGVVGKRGAVVEGVSAGWWKQ
jgi:glycosidase